MVRPERPLSIEDDEHRQDTDNGDAADPTQRHLVEMAPVAAGGLLDRARLLIRQRAAAGDAVELLEELVLLHGARLRIDGGGLLGARGLRADGQREERQRPDKSAESCDEHRHAVSSSGQNAYIGQTILIAT
jgi:hypothetical protein